MIYASLDFICVLWRGGADEHGLVCETRFRPRFFSTANVTTPLKIVDTGRNTLNPVVTEWIVRVVCVVCWGQGLDEVWCMLRQFL